MEVWCLSAAWQPLPGITERVGCRTCRGKHYRHASRAPKSSDRSGNGSTPAASGDRLQHPPRLADAEIVEGGQVDVDRDHRPHGEVSGEAGEEGGDDLLAHLRERGGG